MEINIGLVFLINLCPVSESSLITCKINCFVISSLSLVGTLEKLCDFVEVTAMEKDYTTTFRDLFLCTGLVFFTITLVQNNFNIIKRGLNFRINHYNDLLLI